MNPHSRLKKRELGAYYTPPELSKVLADWAITRTTDHILEPSFGGCGFFESCVNRLTTLGCKDPFSRLFGVDIDKNAFNILNSKFQTELLTEKRFLLSDFITVEPNDFSVTKFDVVIGNPPYVSMHNMKPEQRLSCEKILKKSPFSTATIGRNASLWAFFMLHSLSFLRENGKKAWILPSSLLHADYAKRVLDIHKRHFKQIKIIKLAERFFRSEGAEEVSVVLLAEGFISQPHSECNLSIYSVDTLAELHNAIYDERTHQKTSIEDYNLSLLSSDIKKTYIELLNNPFSKPLGQYLDIKIGMVTGANKYFVIDDGIIEKYSLPAGAIKPIIGRFSSLIGLKHTKHRQKKIQLDGHRAYLFNPTQEMMDSPDNAAKKYLSNISEEEIIKNRTFKKRKNWFEPDYGIDSLIPDGFMSYMIHAGPRLVINQARVNCTNSIHKVFFSNQYASLKFKMAVAVSLLSSYSQLSSEIEGRSYGSGVLKIEPNSGKKIRILLTEACVESLYGLVPSIEAKLKDADYDGASTLVDHMLVTSGLLTDEQCSIFADGVQELRNSRYKGAKNNV